MVWIRSHPTRFRELTFARVVEYGFWLGTIFCLPGLIIMGRRREPVTGFVLFVSLVYPLMYYIVISCDRYRYPILWASYLPAGYCLTVLIAWIGRRRRLQSQPRS